MGFQEPVELALAHAVISAYERRSVRLRQALKSVHHSHCEFKIFGPWRCDRAVGDKSSGPVALAKSPWPDSGVSAGLPTVLNDSRFSPCEASVSDADIGRFRAAW